MVLEDKYHSKLPKSWVMHNSRLNVDVLMLEWYQASAQLNPVHLLGAITLVTDSALARWLPLAKALA